MIYHFLFGPECGKLLSMGLSAVDSLFSVSEKGEVLIPVCNLQETRAIILESMELGTCMERVSEADWSVTILPL